MNIEHDKLRRLFQGYTGGKRPRHRDHCPSPADLADSFETSASVRRKRKIIDHISECPFCLSEFKVLLERQMQDAGSVRSGSAHKLTHPVILRFAGAVLGLGLIAVSLFVVKHQWELSTALRSAGPQITLLEPRPDQSVSGPIVFRWKGRAKSEYYVLELFDEALLPVWTSEKIFDVRSRISADARSRLLPGKRYFWMLTGYIGNSRVEESPLARFIVQR